MDTKPTVANRNNNPGNIRDTDTGKFKVYSSPEDGFGALMNDLEIKKSGRSTTGLKPESTLVEFAKIYAPSSDKNDPAKYAADLANHMGTRPDASIKDLDIGKWAEGIAKLEGYKGTFTHAPVSPQNAPGQAEPTLGNQLTNRLQQAVGYGSQDPNPTGVKLAVSGFQKDNTPGILDNAGRIGMGALDVLGAAGGAIGDVVGAGMNKIIQSGKDEHGLANPITGNKIPEIGNLFEIPEVQAGVKKYQDWATQNPVAARQAGNAFNIITSLIPATKSIGAAKNLLSGGLATEFKGYAGRTLMKEATAKGIDPIKVIQQASNELPDTWWKNILGKEKFHASELKGPIDEMIKNKRDIINKASGKPGVFNTTKQAEKEISGLKVVKQMIDELSKKPGERTLKNKLPIVGGFTAQPKQGLITKALIEKGSQASKNAAKNTLKKTVPVMIGSSIANPNR